MVLVVVIVVKVWSKLGQYFLRYSWYGKMLPGHICPGNIFPTYMLPGQNLLWWLVSVKDDQKGQAKVEIIIPNKLVF